jgi:tetratricopeptide (TPR) repeat protein
MNQFKALLSTSISSVLIASLAFTPVAKAQEAAEAASPQGATPVAEPLAPPSSFFDSKSYIDGMASEMVDGESPEAILDSEMELAQNRRRPAPRSGARPAARSGSGRATRSRPSGGTARGGDNNMAKARRFANAGQYPQAAQLLFQMSRMPQYARQSAQIKYILGMMLFEMKLYQTAAFVFFDVVRQEGRDNPRSKYLRQSLEKLAVSADALDSDVLLRYAIKQVTESDFPATTRDLLYFRTGELKILEKDYAEAARQFNRVRPDSRFYKRARYKLALSLAEAGDAAKAATAFEMLAEGTKDAGVTDRTRVSALLGKARALYQKQDFEGAIDAYREVPRDTEQWHEALFESTWAMLRDGRFRSALSNFHSLHSPYYEDFYQPESLMLRAIVYLYICRYDEMEKVLDLFERVYKPVQQDLRNILRTVNDPQTYYREIAKVRDNFDAIRSKRQSRSGIQIPFIAAREILKEGDVGRTFHYLKNLENERKKIEAQSPAWKSTGVGQYARKIVEKRMEATQAFAGKQIRRHMIIMQNEMRDLFEQSGFLRFEMISGKKETVRKELAGKGVARQKVDQDSARSFYIQNGYEYWPFKGEYWLDEIGNYHYVGVKACE